MPNWLKLQAAGLVDEKKAKIRNCITLFLVGSPGHLDTWDMKPDAPEDIRGKFKPISTTIPGLWISDQLPHLSRIVDRLTIIRSLHHEHSPDSFLSPALTVVKVAKPKQDLRFDVPVVGVKTLQTMREAGATCLAIDAQSCLLLDSERIIEAADAAGIAIVSSDA